MTTAADLGALPLDELRDGTLGLAALQSAVKTMNDAARLELDRRARTAASGAQSKKVEWVSDAGVGTVRWTEGTPAPAVVNQTAFVGWVEQVAPEAIVVTVTVPLEYRADVTLRLGGGDGFRRAIPYELTSTVDSSYQEALLKRAKPGKRGQQAVDPMSGEDIDAFGLVVAPDPDGVLLVVAGVGMRVGSPRLTVSADPDAKTRLATAFGERAFGSLLPALTAGPDATSDGMSGAERVSATVDYLAMPEDGAGPAPDLDDR